MRQTYAPQEYWHCIRPECKAIAHRSETIVAAGVGLCPKCRRKSMVPYKTISKEAKA